MPTVLKYQWELFLLAVSFFFPLAGSGVFAL